MTNFMFYIPSRFTSEARYIALGVAGGYTAFAEAEGAWKDDDGIPCVEPVTPLQVFVEDERADYLLDALSKLLRARDEKSIGYTRNGVPKLDPL